MQTTEFLGKWLVEERAQQTRKFSHASQVEQLKLGRITAATCFGGQAESYWRRLRTIRTSTEFCDTKYREHLLPQAAQYSGKVVSSLTALFTTLKTVNKSDYGNAPDLVISDIVQSLPVDVEKTGYRWLDTPDFYDTPTGLGLAWYAKLFDRRGGIPETNLGMASDLIRLRSIYLDSATMAVAQFNECLEETGVLPIGGTSSGNVTTWRPEF